MTDKHTLVERIARSALRPDDMARTEVVKPVNGTAPYSYITFAGARIEFQQSDFSKYHNGSVVYDAGTDKAAAQATRINDLLFDLAKRATTEAATRITALEAEKAELVGALATRDDRVKRCPINKRWLSEAERTKCSKCGATPSESCGETGLADAQFVEFARATLTKARQSEGEGND